MKGTRLTFTIHCCSVLAGTYLKTLVLIGFQNHQQYDQGIVLMIRFSWFGKSDASQGHWAEKKSPMSMAFLEFEFSKCTRTPAKSDLRGQQGSCRESSSRCRMLKAWRQHWTLRIHEAWNIVSVMHDVGRGRLVFTGQDSMIPSRRSLLAPDKTIELSRFFK